VVIVEQSEGDWLIEGLGALRALRDQEVIQIGETAWQMFIPLKLPSTIRPGGLELHFRVSLDEEHVSIEVRHSDDVYDLGARAHNYLLLTLARQRVSDKQRGLPKSEQGWMHRDVLTRGLRLEYNHLNLLIHRARSAFSRAGVPGGSALLERRLDTGELRIGLAKIEIQTAERR